jgi:cytochrome d ubiquinol oxidase subunit I
MAAAEALFETAGPAPFSVFATGDWTPNPERTNVDIQVPDLLSFLAHGDVDTEGKGVDESDVENQDRKVTNYPNEPTHELLAGKPIDYVPSLPVTYWGFRIMIGFGALGAANGMVTLWLTRRGRIPDSKWFPRMALAGIALPFIANSAGWIFTEMGRQPFVVVPNPSGVDGVWMFTATAVSDLTAGEVWTSLIALTLVYAVLAAVEVFLIARYVRGGVEGVLPDGAEPGGDDDSDDDALAFAY